MAHPHLRMLNEALEQRILGIDGLQMGATILTTSGLLYFSAQRVRNELCAVADAEHGQTAHKLRQIYFERLRVVYAERRTAQYDTNHAGVVLGKLVVGQNLTKCVQLAHAAANELGGLRTKVQDDDFLLHELNYNITIYNLLTVLRNASAAERLSSLPTSSTCRLLARQP